METSGLHAHLARILNSARKTCTVSDVHTECLGTRKKEKSLWITVVRKGCTGHLKLGLGFEVKGRQESILDGENDKRAKSWNQGPVKDTKIPTGVFAMARV